MEHHLRELFGRATSSDPNRFSVTTSMELSRENVSYPRKLILELIGAETASSDDSLISQDYIWEAFPKMPTGRELAEFARASSRLSLEDVGPDQALVNWLDIEYEAFKSLERRAVHDGLQQICTRGTQADVEGFLQFATSVLNRRKSRAGKSLEYHLEQIFRANNILYSSQKHTEGRNQPDFIFPGIAPYQKESFPPQLLTFLGAKRTLKDRWRQILTEAERIPFKHLATVDTSLTAAQVKEIAAADITLVMPQPIISLYPQNMASQFLSIAQFLQLVSDRQSSWQ